MAAISDVGDGERSEMVPTATTASGAAVAPIGGSSNGGGMITSDSVESRPDDGGENGNGDIINPVSSPAPHVQAKTAPMYNMYTAAMSYNGYTITDGALRLIVLLHAADLGFNAIEIAFMFSMYEVRVSCFFHFPHILQPQRNIFSNRYFSSTNPHRQAQKSAAGRTHCRPHVLIVRTSATTSRPVDCS